MRMGFDLDDVVFYTLRGLLDEGIRLGFIPDWVKPEHIEGRVEDQWNISDENMQRLLSVEFFEGLGQNDEVVNDINRWMEEGEHIFFITSRSDDFSPGIVECTAGSLDQCGLLRGAKGVYHQRSSKKWELARDLGLVSFVDDMPHVIRPMVGVLQQPMLLENEHNSNVTDIRRWSWAEVRDEIERLRQSSMCRVSESD